MEDLAKMARKVVEQAPKALRTVRQAAQDIVAGAEVLERALEKAVSRRPGPPAEDEDIPVRDDRSGRKV